MSSGIASSGYCAGGPINRTERRIAVIVALKQELLDPQMAPAVGFCVRCGREIYSRETWRALGGKCPECARSDAALRAANEPDA